MCKKLTRLGSIVAAAVGLLASNDAFAQNLKLPNTTVTANIRSPDNIRLQVSFTGIRSGFDVVTNKTYVGYCIQYYNFNSPTGRHTVQLYDSTGIVPSELAESWGYINY